MSQTVIDPIPGAGVPGWLAPSVVIEGRYRVLSPLGEGGVGAVWVAEHLQLGRRVAVKVLHAEVASDPGMLARFEREAQTLASLTHPHIVSIADYGVWEGTPFLVMELLAGKTLGELLAEGPMRYPRAILIAQQLLRALSYAHARGVVHRDLKPANVFLQSLPDAVDHVKLLDFGFARWVEGPHAPALTAAGIVVGTPWYMAPEAATGAPLDARADVYGVGVLLFEMITGRRPFEGEPLDVLRRRLVEDAPGIRDVRPDLAPPAALETAVARALARDPADRWPSANELALALAAISAEVVAAGSRPTIAVAPSAPSAPVRPVPRRDEPSTPTVTAKAIRPSRSRAPVIAGVIAVVAAVGIVVGGGRRGEGEGAAVEVEPAREVPAVEVEPAREVPAVEVEPEVAAAVEVEPAREAPAAVEVEPDPWSSPLPPALSRLRHRVEARATPTRSLIADLSRYAHDHHDDVRPVLLLAHAFARMHWMDESLQRYTRALTMTAEARRDRHALPDLVLLAGADSTWRAAGTLLVQTFGAEARSALDAALASAPDDETRERLTRLRARLGP